MQKKYPGDERLPKLQVHRLVSLIEFNRLGQLRIANTTTVEDWNWAIIQRTLQRSGKWFRRHLEKSVREVLGDITNKSSYGSAYRALHFDLRLFPYSLSIVQHLKETDINRRLKFAQWMIDNVDTVEKYDFQINHVFI